MLKYFFVVLIASLTAQAQSVQLIPAPDVDMPALVDSNSPAYWYQGSYNVINSQGTPVHSVGDAFDDDGDSQDVIVDSTDHFPMWIEATWMDDDGTLYAWYHHEQSGLCPGTSLAVPEIGALVSYDGGISFQDLGIVISSGAPPDCSAKNGFFAGGNGDFSVILDQTGQYFYFLFDNYGGPGSEQGVAMARMNFADRANPVDAVWKYYQGDWAEPAVEGHDTPIFPAAVSWNASDADSFWGPSVHWNTYFGMYVVFMNRACCSPRWPQKGIYFTYNFDISDPSGWADPDRILEINEYYPQVIGLDEGGTDTVAGQIARLFVGGTSKWFVVFQTPNMDAPPINDPGPIGPSPDFRRKSR